MATKKTNVNPDIVEPGANGVEPNGEVIDVDINDIIGHGTPVADTVDGNPVISADSYRPIGSIADLSTLDEERRNKIISITGTLSAPTPEQEELITLNDITASRDTHKYLTGVVTGLKMVPNKAGRQIPLAIVKYGNYQVYILPEHFIHGPTKADGEYSVEQRQAAYIRQSIGAEVDFYVKKVVTSENNNVSVTGNRVDAMKVKRFRRFFGWDSTGKKIGSPYMYKGAIVEARVVAAKPKFVRLEVMGAIANVLAKEMSYSYIADLRTHFHTGDTILVRINDMLLDEQTGDVQLTVSHKDSHVNPKVRNFWKYEVGELRLATISAINKGGIFVTFEDGVECRCPHCAPPVRPAVGKRVQVRIKHKDEATHNIFGRIDRIIDL